MDSPRKDVIAMKVEKPSIFAPRIPLLSCALLMMVIFTLEASADGIRREIKTTMFVDRTNDYPLDLSDPTSSQNTRDKIRGIVSKKTDRYLHNFVAGFDPEEVKKQLAKHQEAQSVVPGDVMAFIGSFDKIEIDDQFDEKGTEKAKMLFIFKSLLEFNNPEDFPDSAKSAAIEQKDIEQSSAEVALEHERDNQEALKARDYEKNNYRKYHFEIDQSKVIKEDPSDYVENMKLLKEIAAKGGLPNSVTSQSWLDMQADCVDDNGNPKPGVWVHTHADGTIRDFPQDSYAVPPIESGRELACTELDALKEDTPLRQYRDLVSSAEQKVLYVDYEHYPEGMEPTPADIDVNKVGAPGEQVVTDSDHPYGNTKDGTGPWDKKIIRALYWRDISIPIVMIDDRDGARALVSDVLLLWEKMVDAYDTPPDRIPYIIPPLLEPPLPPTTLTRNQFPLVPTYGGR
jgi:hypothetical protein